MVKYKTTKRSGYGLSSPLPELSPIPIKADRSPTAQDNGYEIGTTWINTNPLSADFNDVWMITSVVAGSANWEPIGMDTGGSAPISKYVVDADGTGDYTTVQAAVDAANAAGGGVVWCRPGTYTENLTLYDGTRIRGSVTFGPVTITGVHTPPASGTVIFQDMQLTSATHIFSSAAAGTTAIYVTYCVTSCTNGFLFNLANWTGRLDVSYSSVTGTNNGWVNNTGGATVRAINATLGAGTVNPFVASGGTVTIFDSTIVAPGTFGGAATVEIINGRIENTITTANTATVTIDNTIFETGVNAAISHGSAGILTISNTSITTSNNPAIDGAGAGNVTLTGVEFTDGSNLAATLTLVHTAETRSTKLLCGDGTYRVDAFSGNGNVIQAYCTDATATGANYNKAIRGDMTVSSGDGTDSPQAIRGNLASLSGAHHEEIYGGYFWAEQQDGSQIDSNIIGLVAAAYSLETDAGDLPQQWAFGLQGILFGSDTAAAYAAGIQAGIASYVTYNTSLNAVGHGFVASRNGGGAGGTANAAYKVEAGSAIISDWTYGLDLYNGATGLAYATADVRLWNQTTVLSAATDVTTTYPDTVEALFVMTDSENFRVTNTVDGTFASQIEAIEGNFVCAASASILQINGVYGYAVQNDGSAITSTASAVEGHLNLLETDNADLPPVYAFAVKGYLDSVDGAGVPAGIVAGVGSVVEYNTPFNAKAYGVAVSRLDAGGGAGTAGQAAYGVVQGSVAIADWLYGIDLYNGAAGVAYTTADIRFQNQATIAVDTTGITHSGDVAGRSFNPTNTNIASFDVDPILQSNANTGAAPTGATGDYNIMYLQDRTTMKQFILGAGQTIIAPRLENDGLLISLDLTTSEGAEYYFGHTTRSRHVFTIGTSPAFFVEAAFKVADCGTSDPLWIGFRIIGAPNAAYANYTDAYFIGLRNTTGADTTVIGSSLNGPAWAYQDTGDAWLDGETHTLRINVSATGVVTATIDGAAPTTPVAFTFDNADQVIPCIHHLFAAGGSPAAIHLQSFYCGYQAWN